MLAKLVQNKKEITADALGKAGHALIVLADDPEKSPGFEACRRVLARRNMKAEELAKSPVAVELPGGTLTAWVRLTEEQSVFERHTLLRKALQVLLAEHPRVLTLAIWGAPESRRRAARDAVYAASLNTCVLPSSKSDKPKPAVEKLVLWGAAGDHGRERAWAEGNALTRTLAALPPNALTPGKYRTRVRALAKDYGWKVTEYSFESLKKMGAGAFCAVAQGSPAKDAAIVRLAYKGGAKKAKHVALVGKGICFDTGGHNLKPARYMHGMHEDMTGSAIVLGMMAAASRMKLPIQITGWLALAENHISPAAYRQNEVVEALNGTTIEIVHTDAEGRMVLADTLTLATRDKPELIVDFATLTGSMHYALGSRMSGVFATSSELAHRASKAGQASGERVVIFPQPEDYDEALESQVADIKQCTLEGEADHILATRFLSRFVDKTPWLHVDLSAHNCKGGLGAVATDITGFGVAWGMEILEQLV
jgi:leucyl aminopeptidase